MTAHRQELLHLLERWSALAPDVRFGQLIASLSALAVGPMNEAIWDMEDEQLLAALQIDPAVELPEHARVIIVAAEVS